MILVNSPSPASLGVQQQSGRPLPVYLKVGDCLPEMCQKTILFVFSERESYPSAVTGCLHDELRL